MGVVHTHQEADEETKTYCWNNRRTQQKIHSFHQCDLCFFFFLPWMSLAAIKMQPALAQLVGIKALTLQSRYTFTYKHFHSKHGIQLCCDRIEKPWLKAPQSMKHEESLRYKRRTACYSGKHTVIQRPYTLGWKCLEGKSVFVNDMGQLFWGRLDLYTHL